MIIYIMGGRQGWGGVGGGDYNKQTIIVSDMRHDIQDYFIILCEKLNMRLRTFFIFFISH